MKKLITICVILFVGAGSANAALTGYTDQAGWLAALTTPVSTINWDDGVVTSYYTTISGDRYSGLPASPTLSVDASSALYVVKPDDGPLGTDFFPVSGGNVFSPDLYNPQGILTIS